MKGLFGNKTATGLECARDCAISILACSQRLEGALQLGKNRTTCIGGRNLDYCVS